MLCIKKCVVKDIDLTNETDSKTHIIPSALGGRLKPKGILCKAANCESNDKFDSSLIAAYHPFMVLVGGTRDKSGEPAPVKALDRTGRKYNIEVNEVAIAEHEFIEKKSQGGNTNYSIKARTPKELRILLGRVKKQYPNVNIDELMKSATIQHEPAGKLQFQMQFGPVSTFPSAFIMASLFSSYHSLPPHPIFVNYFEDFDVESPSLPPDTFYFLSEQPWLKCQASVKHCLVLFGDSKRKQAFFFVQLFNQPGIGVVLPYSEVTNVCYTYGIDVLKGQEVKVDVNTKVLGALEWKASHFSGDPKLWKEVESASLPLLAIATQRSFEKARDEILYRYFFSNPGAIITQEDITNAARELAALVMRARGHSL